MATAKAKGRRRGNQRPWWSEWPVALLVGLGSFAMVLTCSLPLVLFSLLAGDHAAGTDWGEVSEPGAPLRIFYVVLALAFLAVPVFTVWSARRRLLGFLLWALVGSFVIMCFGLGMLGIL